MKKLNSRQLNRDNYSLLIWDWLSCQCSDISKWWAHNSTSFLCYPWKRESWAQHHVDCKPICDSNGFALKENRSRYKIFFLKCTCSVQIIKRLLWKTQYNFPPQSIHSIRSSRDEAWNNEFIITNVCMEETL